MKHISTSEESSVCEDREQEMETLLEIFEERIQWRSSPDLIQDLDIISMADSHLLAGIKDVLKIGDKSELGPESHTIFRQEVGELFKVPKLQKPSDKDKPLEKNELLAAFITFLLQLLHHGTDLNVSLEDGMDSLKKELRFLVAVLGDTMVADAELEQVEGLLAEFEEVANQAGILLHSLIFPIQGRAIESVNEAHGVLLRQIDLLKANIIQFSNQSRGAITQKTAAVESLFIVDSLIYDLQNLMNQEGSPIVDVKDLIKSLHLELMFCQSFLKGIKVPLSMMEELKGPAMQIRDAAYEAEYLINYFLVGDIPLWYLIVRLPDVIHKIKLIGSRLKELKKTSEVGARRVAKEFSAKISLQTNKKSELDDIIVIGFKERAMHILDQLVGGTEQLQTICIFGMPGLGKTTFAKNLYIHPSVNYRFDKRSWCIVSQNYLRKSVLTDILTDLASDLDKDSIKNMEEEILAQHIYQILKGRRYLIVMDDIWNSNTWDDLRRYFPNDGNGSRILFTSRIKDVAPSDSIIHPLRSLSDDQCWELLEKRIFRNKVCPPHLLEIGKKIAVKCCGLPLAVVVIAGFLLTLDEEESIWENVERSLASYVFADPTNSVKQVFELSYKHLPDHLKPCFLYLVAFVQQHEIPVGTAKQLWIAEGFICREEKNSERVAEEYFMELVEKSLVMVSKRRSDGGVKACVIHDLLRDFCLRRAEEENFFKLMDHNYSIYEKHRHLLGQSNAIFQTRGGYLRPFGLHVRSLFSHIDCTFVNMRLLRVLDLRMHFVVDCGGMDALVHLRYLATNTLPKSMASFVNLEFLIVNGFCDVYSVISELPKLRVFHTTTARFGESCNCSLTYYLESLSDVRIFSLEDEKMLKCLPHLRRLKCQCILLLVNQRAYRLPDFRFFTQLESLSMTLDLDLIPNTRICEIAEIYFPSSIKKLSLWFLHLPWEKLSIIGELPNLEALRLAGDAFVGERWDARDGDFQQLRFLELTELNFIQWNASSEHFPLLQRLVLERCYKLKQIPSEIGQIVTLQSIEVKWCQNSAVESAIQIQEEQWDMGNEELKVVITRLDDDDSSTSYGHNSDE